MCICVINSLQEAGVGTQVYNAPLLRLAIFGGFSADTIDPRAVVLLPQVQDNNSRD